MGDISHLRRHRGGTSVSFRKSSFLPGWLHLVLEVCLGDTVIFFIDIAEIICEFQISSLKYVSRTVYEKGGRKSSINEAKIGH